MNNYAPPGWKPKPAAQPAQPAPAKPGLVPVNPGDQLRAKFDLPPQPESVEKIANLVKGRANASMDEISGIIEGNTGVTQRLIKIAYPRQDARLGATVQMATSRLGVNRVIVVMVGELLTKAVVETFETMVQMPLEVEDNSAMSLSDHGFLTGSVRFSGQTNGMVTLALSPYFSMMVAAQVLGGEMDNELPPEAVNDAVGELVNMVTGNLQSKLCDAGMTSEVGLPEVTFQATLPKEAIPGGSSDQFFFRHGLHNVAVCLSIDPGAPPEPAAPAQRRAPSTHGNVWRANRPTS